MAVVNFSDLDLMAPLLAYTKENEFAKPTGTQKQSIPLILSGKHTLVLAPPAAGKTLSYALPLCQLLKEGEEQGLYENTAIILLPTKELVAQVYKVIKGMTHFAKLRVRASSLPMKSLTKKDIDAADILIATPNKMSTWFGLVPNLKENVRFVVLDELDDLLTSSHFKETQKCVAQMPLSRVQVIGSSATWEGQMDEKLGTVLPGIKPAKVVMDGANCVPIKVETYNIYCHAGEKLKLSDALIKERLSGPGIIFANRKSQVKEIYETLKKDFPRLRVNQIHGDLEFKERKKVMTNFRDEGGILVGSDVVARGIDIKGLNWIINYDMPFEAEFYIHRSGRVGRHGSKGMVVNLVEQRDMAIIKRINQAIEQQSILKIDPVKVRELSDKKKSATKKAAVKKTTKVEKKSGYGALKKSTKMKRVKGTPRFKRR